MTWLYGVHRTRRDGSSFTWRQPCNNQTALYVYHLGGYIYIYVPDNEVMRDGVMDESSVTSKGKHYSQDVHIYNRATSVIPSVDVCACPLVLHW